jgi:rSAM/selenodomain-associated transferase 1
MTQVKNLLIFIKYPTPGKVKTRLGRALGPETAARLYRSMAEGIVKRLVSQPHYFDTTIFYHPPDKALGFKAWLGSDLSYAPQQGKDLGERMYNAFAATYPRRAVLIGSDCPEITVEIILQAFQALESYDTVIGPSTDGGYYLIGLCRPRAELFQDIDWGTSKVFHQTIKKTEALQLSCHILPTLRDVDVLEDLQALLPHILKESDFHGYQSRDTKGLYNHPHLAGRGHHREDAS